MPRVILKLLRSYERFCYRIVKSTSASVSFAYVHVKTRWKGTKSACYQKPYHDPITQSWILIYLMTIYQTWKYIKHYLLFVYYTAQKSFQTCNKPKRSHRSFEKGDTTASSSLFDLTLLVRFPLLPILLWSQKNRPLPWNYQSNTTAKSKRAIAVRTGKKLSIFKGGN